MRPERCAAAHNDDRSPCDGPVDAVEVVDRAGGRVTGCVEHGATLLRALNGGRVYPGTVQGAAVEVFNRAHAVRR